MGRGESIDVDGAGVSFSFDLEGVEEFEKDLTTAAAYLSRDLQTAALQAGDEAINAMRTNHPYTDHTYLLTDGMYCKPFGRRAKTHAEAVVQFKAKYAKFVNDGTVKSKPYPFLPIGIAAAEKVLEERCAQALGFFCKVAVE